MTHDTFLPALPLGSAFLMIILGIVNRNIYIMILVHIWIFLIELETGCMFSILQGSSYLIS